MLKNLATKNIRPVWFYWWIVLNILLCTDLGLPWWLSSSGWRGRWEGGSGWGTHVNPWLFHFNVWQNSLQIKKKKKESTCQCRRRKKCRFDPWVRNIPWRRKWQPSPLFLPGKSHGQRSLAGYSLWCGKRVRHDLVTKQQQYWFYSNSPEKTNWFYSNIPENWKLHIIVYGQVYTDICPKSKTWKIHIIGKDNYRLISLLNIATKILMIC